MCGIAGIINPQSINGEGQNQPLLRNRLQQMTDSLSHRGPDANRLWISDNTIAAFGHCRLSIIDLSEAASQPMNFLDRYTIIHNGEIYNYIELRDDLRKKGY